MIRRTQVSHPSRGLGTSLLLLRKLQSCPPNRVTKGRVAASSSSTATPLRSNQTSIGWAPAPLFREHGLCRAGRGCRWGRNIECQPEVPARRPIFVGEFAVGLQVDIALHFVSDRKDVADLWADTDHP